MLQSIINASRFFIFFTWILCLPLMVEAQAKINTDSLELVNQSYLKEDTSKVRILLLLAEGNFRKNPSLGEERAQQAVQLARKLNVPSMEADGLRLQAICLSFLAKYAPAIELLDQAIALYEKTGNKTGVGRATMNKGATYSFQSKDQEALEQYEKALVFFRKQGDKKQESRCLGSMAAVYTNSSQNDKALDHYQKALAATEGINDFEGQLFLLSNLAVLHFRLGNYLLALDYNQKGLKTNEKVGNMVLAGTMLSVNASIYEQLEDYTKALETEFKALEVQQRIKNPLLIAKSYINISTKYFHLKEFQKALDYQNKALEILLESTNKTTLAICYLNIGVSNMELSNYGPALENLNKALSIARELNLLQEQARVLADIADIYLTAPDDVIKKAGILPENKLSESEKVYLESLKIATDIGASDIQISCWLGLSEVYERMNNYPSAYSAYKNSVSIKDSIAGDDVKKQITRKEIQFEFDKKEAALQFEQQLTIEQLEQHKLLSIQQRQALALSDKEKELQRLAYLKEKAEKQEKEQLLTLAEKDKQLQAFDIATLAKEKALQLQDIARKNAVIGFLIAGLAAFLLAFIAFYQWIRRRQAKKEAHIQTQFTQQLLENIEEERGRIAIDLHDSVSHELLSLKRNLSETADASGKIDGIIDDIRQISRNLHPVMLDKIGLQLSLETLCEQFMQNENIFVAQDIQYHNSLSKPAELQLFRIVQESLTNAHKYAGAEAVQVQLNDKNGQLSLQIRDNGRGFDVEKALSSGKAFGLHSIIQRSKAIGGKVDIQSSASGTVISLRIPIPER